MGEGSSLNGVLRRYGFDPAAGDWQTKRGTVVGIAAELAKKNAERRLMHEWLTEAGIPEQTSNGEGVCLLGRLAIALGRLP